MRSHLLHISQIFEGNYFGAYTCRACIRTRTNTGKYLWGIIYVLVSCQGVIVLPSSYIFSVPCHAAFLIGLQCGGVGALLQALSSSSMVPCSSSGGSRGVRALPGRTYIRPPPSPHFWPKGIFQGRGVGVYILRPHAAGILYAPPLLYTPHP